MTILEQQAIIEEYRCNSLQQKGLSPASGPGLPSHRAISAAWWPGTWPVRPMIVRYYDSYTISSTDTAVQTPSFHSAAILFEEPVTHSDELFDSLMWQRLQALSNLDAENYGYDPRVDAALFPELQLQSERRGPVHYRALPRQPEGRRRFSRPVLLSICTPNLGTQETGRYQR